MSGSPSTGSASSGSRRLSSPVDEAGLALERALFEVKKVVVGQDRMVERMLVALLARGHCLLEGVPGVAKSLAVETLATVVGGSSVRLQFTPDLVPSDIVGTRIYRPSQEAFDVELGPVFANLVLADEINRAPAKVQSALLEVMAERQVSIGGTTYPLPRPFLVLATQNPIESEGVYPLPEAQRDRFTARVSMGYPDRDAELAMLDERATSDPLDQLRPVTDAAAVTRLVAAVGRLHVAEPLRRYVVSLVEATRRSPDLRLGASPRAGLQLLRSARAAAALAGRDHVLPDDVQDMAVPVLAHRLLLTPDAALARRSAERVVADLLRTVPVPRGA